MSSNVTLPWKISTANNPTRYALKYFLTFMATLWGSIFIFKSNMSYAALMGIGAIAAGIGLMVLFAFLDRKKKKTIEISSEGIVQVKNNVVTAIKWTDEHQTYYDGTNFVVSGILPVGSVVTTQVVAPGKRIRIDYPANDFHTTILTLSHKARHRAVEKQLAEGKRVYFGPVEMDKMTVYINNKAYVLSDISNAQVEQGFIKLNFQNKWFATKIPVKDVPDFTSFLKLIKK